MVKIREILAIFDPPGSRYLMNSLRLPGPLNWRPLGCPGRDFPLRLQPIPVGRAVLRFARPAKGARLLHRQVATSTSAALADTIDAGGARVRTDAVWDAPLDQGIVRKVLRSKPDLVVKEVHAHPRLQRAIFTNTDWHLVRNCPAPLLLRPKGRSGHRGGPVIGAVDPMHDNDKPAQLDAADH